MAGYEYPEREYPEREYSHRYVREERRSDRDARYASAPEYTKTTYTSRDLIPRAHDEGDYAVEDVRRDYAPPTGRREVYRYRQEECDDYDDPYDARRGYGSRHHHRREYDPYARDPRYDEYVHEDRALRHRHKSKSKQDKIIAAVAGAALLVGGKELYDRHEAKTDGAHVHRNPLSSAALAGFGALAGYQGAEFYSKQQARRDQKATYILHQGRDGTVSEYFSDDDVGPREKKGHRNFLESALAATGLSAAVKSLTGESRSHHGSSAGSPTRSRSRGASKMQKAAMASLLAGATEAFRVAKEPGGWKGEKTKRILTAAATAATVDAAQDDGHGGMGLAESVIGGLVGNRLLNGSKRDIEEDRMTGRSRSRSRAPARSRSRGAGGAGPSGLAALATAGIGALGAKKILDRSRSRSRGRDIDSRASSPDRRRHHRSRSRSVVDRARNGLAKLGIGAAAADDRAVRDPDSRGESRRRSHRHHDELYDEDDDGIYERGQQGYPDEPAPRHSRRDSPRYRGGNQHGYTSESDLGDSEEDERRARKMKGKQILTNGLAAVATIHAVHGVYQSMEKSRARQRAVREGRMSPTRAKALKTKALLQDAASIGIAALGIKGAIGEMKEAKEAIHECKEFEHEKARRHEKRVERERRRQSRAQSRSDRDRRPASLPPDTSPLHDELDLQPLDFGPRYYDDNPYGAVRGPALPSTYRQ